MRSDGMQYFPVLNWGDIEGLLESWRADYPAMGVLALVPEAEKESVGKLQGLFSRLGIPLAGAIFPALVTEEGFRTGGVWLLRFDTMPHAAIYDALPTEPEAAAVRAAEISDDLRRHLDDTPDVTLFLLFDALVPTIGTLLDEFYLHLANRVHYLGANAGSETFQPMPCLFDNGRLVGDGVLALLVKAHRGGILEHGYRAPENMIYATSTEGNRIIDIDWRPAFEVYRDLMREQYGVEITRENFYSHAVHFPFGIVRANHSVLVRIPVALGDDGSLFCVGEVPPNSLLTLLEAPAVDSCHTLQILNEGLAGLNGGVAGRELLLFYCAGRYLHLGPEAAAHELEELKRLTGAVRIAGAKSLGEIGPSTVGGYPLFHNATLVGACL